MNQLGATFDLVANSFFRAKPKRQGPSYLRRPRRRNKLQETRRLRFGLVTIRFCARHPHGAETALFASITDDCYFEPGGSWKRPA